MIANVAGTSISNLRRRRLAAQHFLQGTACAACCIGMGMVEPSFAKESDRDDGLPGHGLPEHAREHGPVRDSRGGRCQESALDEVAETVEILMHGLDSTERAATFMLRRVEPAGSPACNRLSRSGASWLGAMEEPAAKAA
jgi:hypothetical protein